MIFMLRKLTLLLAMAVLLSGFIAACDAAGPRYWNVTPYQVQIDVIPVGTVLSEERNFSLVLNRLQEKCDTRLQPLWNTEVSAVLPDKRLAFVKLLGERLPSSEAVELLTSQAADTAVTVMEGTEVSADKVIKEVTPIDKRILLQIEQRGSSLYIRCREYDTVLKRWGMLHEEQIPSLVDIEESLLRAVTNTFSPLVAFEIDPKDPTLVHVQVRGGDLKGGRSLGTPAVGTVLLPFLRRVDREGNPIPDGLSQVAWTYLVVPDMGPEMPDEEEALEPDSEAEPSSQVADVYSHIRMPFGSRRRGRIQQIAIAVHHDPTLPTQLQLYAQHDESIPLEGYEVFIGLPGQGSDLTRLGRTDKTGSIWIPESEEVLMAHVKSGSTVVASLPIAPGVNPLLRAPLLDERQRLAAESKLSAMQEQLIDLVAQRQILQSRIRRRIEAEDIDMAETLMRELESLPGQAQFNQQLAQAEQFYRADHPLVQRRLDRIFSQTRAVLGSSLDAREIRKIASEVIYARQQLGAIKAE